MSKLLLSILLIIFSKFSMAFSYTLEISEAELQEKVSALMPIEKKKYFISIVLSNPDVNLLSASNEIEIATNIEATAPGGLSGNGNTRIKGTLSYNPDEGAFYFHNPTIVDLTIEKIPNELSPKIKKLAQQSISKYMSRYPIYKFKDDNLKHKLAKAALESVNIENQSLKIKLSAF